MHWSDWPFLGLCVVVLAPFIDSSNGIMNVRDELLDFARATMLLELAPFVLLLIWAPIRLATRGYSRLPPLLGVAAGLLAIVIWLSDAFQAAARS